MDLNILPSGSLAEPAATAEPTVTAGPATTPEPTSTAEIAKPAATDEAADPEATAANAEITEPAEPAATAETAEPIEPAEPDKPAELHYDECFKELHVSLGSSFDIGDIKDWLRAIEYAAFDVLELRKKIKRMINKNDVILLVKVFLMNKLLKKDQVKFQVLSRKLKIKQNANRNNQVITLFRIAQSFPEVVAVMLHAHPNIAGPLTLAQMRLHSECPEFPALALQPLLACLLPRDHPESLNILNVFFLSNMMLSETFYKKSELRGSKTKLERASEIQTKQMNHFKSKICNEDLRKGLCTQLKIMVDNEYSTVWIEAATKSKAKLMETYGISC